MSRRRFRENRRTELADEICAQKQRWKKGEACEEVARLKALGERSIRAYRCPVDPSHWHIGHDRGKAKGKGRRGVKRGQRMGGRRRRPQSKETNG